MTTRAGWLSLSHVYVMLRVVVVVGRHNAVRLVSTPLSGLGLLICMLQYYVDRICGVHKFLLLNSDRLSPLCILQTVRSTANARVVGAIRAEIGLGEHTRKLCSNNNERTTCVHACVRAGASERTSERTQRNYNLTFI